MKKTNKLKILTVILMGILILCSARITFAAQAINNISTIPITGQNNTSNNSAPLNNIANNTANTAPNNTLIPNNTNNTQNQTLPKTGAELSVGLVGLISFVSISAIYTYIKVKRYNI